jgi:hypothetical protein
MVVHTYNPSTQEAEAGGLQVGGQPGLHSKISSQKKKNLGVAVNVYNLSYLGGGDWI